MKKTYLSFFILLCILSVGGLQSCTDRNEWFEPVSTNSLRAPAYPLVTIDPYTSAWSFTDDLYEGPVRHWTGKEHPLIGAIRVDGCVYRFLGTEELSLKTILPTAAVEKWEASFTEKAPAKGWNEVNFNAATWQTDKAAFGTAPMPHVQTLWESPDIWVRRTFELTEDLSSKIIYLEYSHDDGFELYLDGIELVNTGYCWNNNVMLELSEEVCAQLKPGKHVLAAHCNNKVGDALVDFGLYQKEARGDNFAKVAKQKAAVVMPTSTYYRFHCGPVQLNAVFTSPLLLDDLNRMSTPINYISYQVQSLDDRPHDVQIYFEASPLWAMDHAGQPYTATREEKNGFTYLKVGTKEQNILGKKGDNVRIDWGHLYLASSNAPKTDMAIGDYFDLKYSFLQSGRVEPVAQQLDESTQTTLAYTHDLGSVQKATSGYVMIGYDDIESIQYFKENRQAYWKQNGKVDIYQAFEQSAAQYDQVMSRCRKFDEQLIKEATKAGGKKYAELCALAYRQAIAAHKLITDKEGDLLFLSKENFSNGSIGTVDVTYPSAPLFLRYNPDLLKGMLNPIFYFSESGQWQKPFAAHDVGTYPLANGQTYGGDMPVEECGNMLTLVTAIAMVEGNANYAAKHWTVLTTWANYLLEKGLDPDNQLCTDDFAGHFAHNANLSIKAIMGIAGYGKLAGMLGEESTSKEYIQKARDMAEEWVKMANAGDHYRLTFDQPDTWSQKYNLIWDRIFGLNIFPEIVAEREMDFYQTVQNKYGLPLDSRKTYTKSDWIMWSACLIDDADKFQSLINPIHKYANETADRIPLSDWHETTNGKSVGFRARSVVGGYYMKMLIDKMTH
ncbi:MAG: glutaminase domain-containing protein [Parabacteroides sp.]